MVDVPSKSDHEALKQRVNELETRLDQLETYDYRRAITVDPVSPWPNVLECPTCGINVNNLKHYSCRRSNCPMTARPYYGA